jgi:drug/metabolite transporter (DMT)-like permease
MLSKKYNGIFFVILSALLFGLAGTFNVLTGLPALSQNFYRFLISAIIIILIVVIKKTSIRILKADYWKIIIIGIASLLTAFCVNEAVLKIDVGVAIFILYTSPIIVAIVAPYFLKEIRYINIWIALILSMIGIYLINFPWNQSSVNAYGLLWAILAAIFFSVVILVSKFLSARYSPIANTFWRTVLSFVFIAPFFLFFSDYSVSYHQLTLLTAMSFLISIFATITFFYGVKEVSSQQASILLYLEPVSAGIYALIFLGQKFSVFYFFGAVLIVLANIFLLYKNKNLGL